MLPILLTMGVILMLAGVVTAYVAFPRRGRDLPVVPSLGHAMERGMTNLPTLDRVER